MIQINEPLLNFNSERDIAEGKVTKVKPRKKITQDQPEDVATYQPRSTSTDETALFLESKRPANTGLKRARNRSSSTQGGVT